MVIYDLIIKQKFYAHTNNICDKKNEGYRREIFANEN